MNQSRILIVLLAFCAVLLMPFSAQAKRTVPSAAHPQVMSPAGEYVVYVLQGGEWKEAGRLSYNKYFTSESIDLSKFISGQGNVKIRLVEKGGGAAHIDAVFLGDKPAVKVKGLDDALALKKLGKKDFDVVEAFGKSIELVFPGGAGNVMTLAARVEGTRIADLPFEFPLSNIGRNITGNSAFYSYRLTTGKALGKAGTADMTKKPFFKEFSATGSGHPTGYTYGWVRNDNKNLYVTIDFTPDDTMDGAKDYSKVYVKTKEGVKEFKVSVPETKWGTPHFTYTDKVAYQHKVYDFRIPLKKIGIENAKKKDELQLAFAAYGTASVEQTAICRSSGFWGTHAGTAKRNSINITDDVISVAGGCSCISVCGMAITNTELSDANSALEALCVSPKDDIQLQLISQLTAATLNCAMSQDFFASGDCSTCGDLWIPSPYQTGAINIGELVQACNSACTGDQTTATIYPHNSSPVIVNCIDALNCFNNGGSFDAGTGPATATCQTGICSPGDTACGIQGLPACNSENCEPLSGSCASRPLCQGYGPTTYNLCFDADAVYATCPLGAEYCSPAPGPAGSSKMCHDAMKNDCVLGGDCDTSTSPSCPE